MPGAKGVLSIGGVRSGVDPSPKSRIPSLNFTGEPVLVYAVIVMVKVKPLQLLRVTVISPARKWVAHASARMISNPTTTIEKIFQNFIWLRLVNQKYNIIEHQLVNLKQQKNVILTS
jgi:hypothetical protein